MQLCLPLHTHCELVLTRGCACLQTAGKLAEGGIQNASTGASYAKQVTQSRADAQFAVPRLTAWVWMAGV